MTAPLNIYEKLDVTNRVEAVTEGVGLASYRYTEYKDAPASAALRKVSA